MKSTKIYFATHFDILRARTNQISDIRFCEGFSENNCDVEMIVPFVYRKNNMQATEINQNYGITKPLDIKIMATPFWSEINKFRFLIYLIFLNVFLLFRLALTSHKYNKVVLLSRASSLLYVMIWLKKIFRPKSKLQIVYWAHDFKTKKTYKYAYKYADNIIATNSSILDSITKVSSIKYTSKHITLNPVSSSQAAINIDKQQIRTQLQLPSKPLVVYTGKLYIGHKEAEYILQAAANMPHCTFLLTGGQTNVISHYKEKYKSLENVIFTGFLQQYSELINYQFAADILISYYTADDHQLDYNLPQKIVEYMLTGNAIITPEYAATKDVLNTENCFFTEAENASKLTATIQIIIDKPELAKAKGQLARTQALEMTFGKRTKQLLEIL